MATLREIRRKLRSVDNIQKITRAMEMVAASRLKKAQEKAEQTRPYSLKLEEMLQYIISMQDSFTHSLTEARPVKKICYIVIASDKGLCGSFNHVLFAKTEKLLKQTAEGIEVELILFGRKAIDYFSSKKWNIREKFVNWGGKISLNEVKSLLDRLIQDYLSKFYDEVWIIYTHYVNLVVHPVKIEKLLNVNPQPLHPIPQNINYIFEPNASTLFSELLPRYCLTKLQTALHESYASELAARIFSMRAATKNSEEMIEKLTLTRNKIRQATITKELIEITAGVESLK